MKGESIIIASNKPNDLKTDCLKIKFIDRPSPNWKRNFGLKYCVATEFKTIPKVNVSNPNW